MRSRTSESGQYDAQRSRRAETAARAPRRRALVSPAHADHIKTRERVRELAEVYTHKREVTAMLDLVADMFPSDADPGNIDRKFLEPAAGSGNFLEEILRRQLAYVTTPCIGTTSTAGMKNHFKRRSSPKMVCVADADWFATCMLSRSVAPSSETVCPRTPMPLQKVRLRAGMFAGRPNLGRSPRPTGDHLSQRRPAVGLPRRYVLPHSAAVLAKVDSLQANEAGRDRPAPY